ncbi:hypothetical protein GBK02_12140 [Dechloromonas sp. TW-R-39-2]|uniref:hypothetical protein n=1 Tax=Dechloromonas sp. TW-R-39-2 TaxID=2654218 RepID=UPI00193E516A|nr:hypothetical protein [Dechloromonas sp. TW-R-39-2]QRM20092.1 hypothetical protein GBK02_12140 [Dechloromonas sp. TW-R-39-2]
MDIKSVTSNISAYTGAASQSQQVQQAERREPRQEEQVERKEEAPKAVTNAEGQKTGSVINVTA